MNYSEIYNDLIKIEKDFIRVKLFYPYYTFGFSNVFLYDKYLIKLLKKLEENEK